VNRRLFLLLIVALAGCRSSQPTPSSAPADQNQTSGAVVAPAATSASNAGSLDSRPVIVAFGDSLTAGFGADPGQSYPDFLQRELDARGYHYHVVNSGVSGNTTKDGVERLKDVFAVKPAVVVVAFGGNDGLRGLPIADTRSNLDEIVGNLTRAHVKVVLGGITLPPNYGPDYISEFNATYTLLARKYRAPLLPFLLIHVYDVPGSMQEDGIHATAQGNRQVALNLLPLVTPLLRK
jgi:acyl-CoA thioesterase I